MPENPATSGVPVERLEVMRNTWIPPENPLLALEAVDGSEIGVGQRRGRPQPQEDTEPPEPTGGQEEPVYSNGQAGYPEIKGNPWARLRVVEKEKKRAARELEDTKKQLDTLMAAVHEKLLSDGAEEEEEVIDPSNPLDAIVRGQQKLLDEVEGMKRASEEKDQLTEAQQIEQVANSQIRGFMQQAESIAPGLYQNAMAYLANVKLIEFQDDQDLSEEDAKAAVSEWVGNIKNKALRNGENPGELLFKRATMSGFNAQEWINGRAPQPEKAKQPIKQNPAEQIRQENKKKASLGSISGLQGSSPQDPLRGLAALPEKERIRTIMGYMNEAGTMRRRRPPSLEELLKHKERK